MSPGAGERDDAALLRAVARGDEESLAVLYNRHAGWLTVRMTRRCAMPDVVGHAVQDTFLALWRDAGAYHGGGDAAAFIWAIAAPVSFAAIALAWYAPVTSRFLAEPPATLHGVTIAWYAVASAASALTCAAMRDRWHRYSRSLHRLSSPGPAPRGTNEHVSASDFGRQG
jgi:hypothetical protein